MSLKPKLGDYKHYVFVYGTLKRGQPNHHEFLNNENGQARLVGYAVTLNKWPLVIGTSVKIPFLRYDKGRGHIVSGEVYQVDDKMREFCDDFEWHPRVYTRDKISVKMTKFHAAEEEVTTLMNSMNLRKSGSSDGGVVLECDCYFFKHTTPYLLNLEPVPCYDSATWPLGEYDLEQEIEVGEEGLLREVGVLS